MKTIRLFIAVLLLSACAQLGLPTADTCMQKVAVGYGSVTSIRTSALQALQAKKMSAEDAQNVQNQADHARVGVDIASKLCAGDPTAAGAKLTAITTVLQALSAYLATKGT